MHSPYSVVPKPFGFLPEMSSANSLSSSMISASDARTWFDVSPRKSTGSCLLPPAEEEGVGGLVGDRPIRLVCSEALALGGNIVAVSDGRLGEDGHGKLAERESGAIGHRTERVRRGQRSFLVRTAGSPTPSAAAPGSQLFAHAGTGVPLGVDVTA